MELLEKLRLVQVNQRERCLGRGGNKAREDKGFFTMVLLYHILFSGERAVEVITFT